MLNLANPSVGVVDTSDRGFEISYTYSHMAVSRIVLFLAAIIVAEAAVVGWTAGAGTSDWHTPGNWNTSSVPTSVDDVIISQSPCIVRITAPAIINSLIVGGLKCVLVISSADLTIQGQLSNGFGADIIGWLSVKDATLFNAKSTRVSRMWVKNAGEISSSKFTKRYIRLTSF